MKLRYKWKYELKSCLHKRPNNFFHVESRIIFLVLYATSSFPKLFNKCLKYLIMNKSLWLHSSKYYFFSLSRALKPLRSLSKTKYILLTNCDSLQSFIKNRFENQIENRQFWSAQKNIRTLAIGLLVRLVLFIKCTRIMAETDMFI